MAYHKIYEKIKTGELFILDGGTGTELEKRGVPMDPGAWCGVAALDNANILEEIQQKRNLIPKIVLIIKLITNLYLP